MSQYTMFYKYGKRPRDVLGRFYCYFSLVFYILGTFLIKQLFQSRMLVIRWLWPTGRVASSWLSTIFNIARTLVLPNSFWAITNVNEISTHARPCAYIRWRVQFQYLAAKFPSSLVQVPLICLCFGNVKIILNNQNLAPRFWLLPS